MFRFLERKTQLLVLTFVRMILRSRHSTLSMAFVERPTLLPHHHRHCSLQRAQSSLSLSSSSSTVCSNDDDCYTVRQSQMLKNKYQQLQQASTLALAPMMDYTDRHFRHLVRLISSQTLLYTEMVAANALAYERRQQRRQLCLPFENLNLHNDNKHDDNHHEYLARFLAQGAVEPLEGASVLQLGGSNPQLLYEATQAVLEMNDCCDYTAINLNCGCPSPKVAGKGCFGAALMDDAALVAQCTRAMHEGIQGQCPITVKCRIGTDSQQTFRKSDYVFGEREYSNLCHFIETVAANGIVTDFSVHARIAVLSKSFSPADNRKIPPLEYDIVRRLVRDFPSLRFTLNGGVESMAQVQAHLQTCPGLAGVMVGRAWAADPWSFAMADRLLYGQTDAEEEEEEEESKSECYNRLEIVQAFGKHADHEESIWDPVKIRRFLIKAISPLFTGEPNSKRYRIALDEIAGRPKALAAQGKSLEQEPPISELILNAALEHLSQETLLQTPEESYEKRQWQEEQAFGGSSRSIYIAQWQTERKMDRDATYNRTLHDPSYSVSALGT